jgi:hypothetical protein
LSFQFVKGRIECLTQIVGALLARVNIPPETSVISAA